MTEERWFEDTEKTAICKSRRKVWTGPPLWLWGQQPAKTLISDFYPLETGEKAFLLFKPPSLEYIVMAAPTNSFSN